MKFGTDGDGNYGYYGADGSLIPFLKPLKLKLEKTVTTSGRGAQYANFYNYFVDDSGTKCLICSNTVDNFTAGHDNTRCGLITYVTRNGSTGYHTYKNNLTVPLIRDDGVTIPAGGTFTDKHDGSTFTLTTVFQEKRSPEPIRGSYFYLFNSAQVLIPTIPSTVRP